MLKKFRLDDIFEISGTKSLDAGKVTFIKDGINFIGRTGVCNGIQGKIAKQDFEPNEANTITATVIGNYKYVKFQAEPYYCSQNINKLKLKSNFGIELNYKIALFLMAYIKKFIELYNGQQGGYKLSDLSSLELKLPVDVAGKIDFKYMEKQIDRLELEHLDDLKRDESESFNDYLKVTGLSDYALSKKDKQILGYTPKLRKYKVGHSYCKRKKIEMVSDDGLFDIVPTKKKINANKLKFEGKYPYVARGEGRNGIKGYIDYNPQFLNPANTISFGQDTATMGYQPNEYFTGDKIQIFKLNKKYGELTEYVAMYLIGAMKKSFANFAWGTTSFAQEVLANIDVALPVTNDNTIDFDYMRRYIQAIQKLVIGEAIQYKEQIINKTENIIKYDK